MNEWAWAALSDSSHFEYLSGLWKGKVPPFETAIVIRNTNFRRDGRLDLSDVAVLDVEARQLERKRLQRGDIIIERSGGGPQQPVGRVCFFDTEGPGPYSFSNFTTALRVRRPETFLPRFVHYYLLYLYDDGFTVPLQRATTGIRNLDFTAYLMAEVPQPPRPEQEKIAAVLWKVQRATEVEDKLIATVRELKRAAMQQLFTRGLRGEPQKETEIGLVPESWEVLPLGQVGRIGNGSTPKRNTVGYWHGGSTPWLTSGKIHEGVITQADEFVSDLAVKECHLPRVKSGSVLVAITGQGKTLGNTALVAFDTCISQHLAYIQLDRVGTDGRFVRHYLSTRYDHLRQLGQSGGSTKGALTCASLREYLVPLPRTAEQREIADILDAIDMKVSMHQRKCATLQDLFKTLLHELMTGRLRVAELDIDVSEVTAA